MSAQDYFLEITSLKENERNFLRDFNYIKKHTDTISLHQEISNIQNQLKNQGFFTSILDSIKKNKTKYVAYFSLGKKTKQVQLNTTKEIAKTFFDSETTPIYLPIQQLQFKLQNISKKLDEDGFSFAKVQLRNSVIKNDTLVANLTINKTIQRKINRIFVKGYDEFPKSFLKNYFQIKKQTTFSQKKIDEISLATKNLNFVKEIKAPEVLFTKDSTLLYVYLQKNNTSNFDALVNFASEENGDLLFNGYIDLELNNILNTGENFKLLWNSIGNERQEFIISTEIPYIFNSPITPTILFSIYKQDSTFINTKFESNFNYNINDRLKLAITYDNESSEDLKEDSSTLSSFKNNLVGFSLNYSILNQDVFQNKKINLTINPKYGRRTSAKENSNQFKIETQASYLWELNTRNFIYLKNELGYLKSDQYYTNELFRIGGANTIRGFNEQSIFTNSYTYFNIEYRFLTSLQSYFYSITDIGVLNNNEQTENLLGLGLGYLFFSSKSKININLTIGKTSNTPFNLNNTKLIIGWKNYF